MCFGMIDTKGFPVQVLVWIVVCVFVRVCVFVFVFVRACVCVVYEHNS